MSVGINTTWAAEQEVAVKMTYINGSEDATDTAYGAVETAYAGYNKISNGTVALGNSGWGVNNIAYLQIDASAVPGPIQKVTLSGSFQQISKRGLWYGFGYNNSVWSDALTWNNADRTITLIEGAGVSCGKSENDLEASVDITPAFANDEDKIVTLIVYQTAAGGGYIKDAKAVVEYSKADETLVSYSFDNGENPAITVGNKATAAYGITTTGENEESIFTPYVSPINGGGFLNVWGANDNNGESTFAITPEDITSNGQWTLEFDWAGYGGCNKKAGATTLYDANNNAIFSIADVADWNNTMNLSFGGTIDVYPCNKATRISANTGTVLTAEYWHHFTVIGTANGISVTIEKYAVDEDGAITKTVVVKNGKASASNATPAKMGLKPGSCGSVAIDNLKLTVGDLKIVSYDYTVKFVTEDGTEFKDAETRNAIEGEALAATDADKATITEGKTQYIYLSDDAAERTVEEEGLVLTITYQKLSVANYVVNYVDAAGNALKDATTHANAKVGTKVGATVGEMTQILVENTLYNYVSGADSLTVAEDETANVINLVFAPVEGIEAYYLQNYEAATDADWKTSVSGRYDPIFVNGNGIANREIQYTHVDTIATAVIDEEGNPVVDEEGNPTYTYSYNTVVDSTASVTFANQSKFLTVNQGNRNNNGATLTNSAISVDESNFTVEARILLGSSNDQAGTTLTLFNKAGDAAILKLVQNGKSATSWKVNDDAEKLLELPNSGTTTGSSNDNLSNLSWYNFKVTVYNGLTFLTVTDEEGTAIFDKEQITTVATTYGLGKMTFASSRYNANFAIDDVLVRNVIAGEDVPGNMEFAEVQINYVDAEGNVLKAAETAKFSIGSTVELNSAFTADFKVDETGAVWTSESETAPVTKYIYVSDNSAETVAAEGASVNIVYRGVGSRRIALRPQIQLADGTMATKDASGANLPFFYDSNKAGDVLFEGDVLTYYYPYYLLVDGLLYKTGANSGNDDHGTLEVEAGNGALVKTPITWTAATESVQSVDEEGNPAVDEEGNPIMEDVQISNVVYAQETENIEGMTVVKDGYTTIRMANGAAGSAIGGNVLVTTLEPGVYTITSATRSGTTNFLANEEVVFTISSTGTVQTATSEAFTLTEETSIYIAEQATTSQYNDYVLIAKVGDYVAPVKTELANADFSQSTPTAVGVHTYEKDIVKDEEGNALDVAQAQEVEGWTITENGDARAAAVYAYGSEAYLGGEGYVAPATNPEGAAEGNALGLVGVWTGKIQYTQTIQLPAGEYMLEVPVYNAGGTTAVATNLIGVNDTYATTTKYAVGQWTTEQVKFTLAEEAPVTVSLGYVAANAGSGAMPHLFIDQVKILGEAEIAAAELAAAKANALAEIEALPQGDGLFCYGWDADFGYAAYYYEAQDAINAAEDIAGVDAAVAAYKATMALPDPETEYMLQSKQNDLYLTLSEAGVQIAEKPTAVTFEAAEDGKYYIKAGEFYVGLAGTDNWSMSADPEKKAGLTITLTDGYYTLAQEKGLVGVDYPKKDNYGCWADKKTSDGDAVLWTISEYGVLDIDLASLAVEVGTELDDEDMVDVMISYTVNEVAGSFEDVEPQFIATLYKGEEVVKEFEFTTYTYTLAEDGSIIPGSIADGGLVGGISGIEYDTEYTLVLTKVQFWSGFTADWTYNYVYSKDVEVKSTFVIHNPATAITSLSTSADADIEAVYTIGGAQLQGLQKGMNIVKYADGSVKKVFVK